MRVGIVGWCGGVVGSWGRGGCIGWDGSSGCDKRAVLLLGVYFGNFTLMLRPAGCSKKAQNSWMSIRPRWGVFWCCLDASN